MGCDNEIQTRGITGPHLFESRLPKMIGGYYYPGTMEAVNRIKLNSEILVVEMVKRGKYWVVYFSLSYNAEKKVGLNGPLVFNRLDAAANGMSSSIANYDDDVSLDSIMQNIQLSLDVRCPTPNVSTVKKETGRQHGR